MLNKVLCEQKGIQKPTLCFFADDQVIIADSEDNLQRGLFTIQNIAKMFGAAIASDKSEAIVFLGQDSVRCKIVVDNKRL